MGGFAAILPTIIPAVGTIVKEVVDAIKGATPTGPPTVLSGDLATKITNAPGFANAVTKQHDQTLAANIAATAVPDAVSKLTAAGAKVAVDSVSQNRTILATQLATVERLLELLYGTNSCLFGIFYFLDRKGTLKGVLDAADKSLLADLWSETEKGINDFVTEANKSLPTIEASSGARIEFEKLVNAWKNVVYHQIGKDLAALEGSASAALLVNVHSLWEKVNGSAVAGGVTLNEIARGADSSIANNPPTPLKNQFHLLGLK